MSRRKRPTRLSAQKKQPSASGGLPGGQSMSEIIAPAIGVDLVDVVRLQRVCERQGELLLRRLFTQEECVLSQGSAGYRWSSLAGRFAVKEAVKKILAAHGESVGWNEIEVVNGIYGEPAIKLSGRARSAVDRLGYTRLLASISHDADLAIATVMAA